MTSATWTSLLHSTTLFVSKKSLRSIWIQKAQCKKLGLKMKRDKRDWFTHTHKHFCRSKTSHRQMYIVRPSGAWHFYLELAEISSSVKFCLCANWIEIQPGPQKWALLFYFLQIHWKHNIFPLVLPAVGILSVSCSNSGKLFLSLLSLVGLKILTSKSKILIWIGEQLKTCSWFLQEHFIIAIWNVPMKGA